MVSKQLDLCPLESSGNWYGARCRAAERQQCRAAKRKNITYVPLPNEKEQDEPKDGNNLGPLRPGSSGHGGYLKLSDWTLLDAVGLVKLRENDL